MVVLAVGLWPTVLTAYIKSPWAVTDSFRIVNYLLSFFLLITSIACIAGHFDQRIIWIYLKTLWIIVFTTLMLFAADRIYGLVKKPHASNIRMITSGGEYEEDYLLGSKPGKNLSRHVVSIRDSDTLFNVTYHTDNLGRRVSVIKSDSIASHFLIFFGCSVTWGWGLEDSATLPSQTAYLCRTVNAYNYAFPGYGPQHMLAIFESKNMRREISEQEGALVYVFIPHHVNRAIGDMIAFNHSGRSMPWYDYDDNGKLLRKGNFTNRKWKNKLFRILDHSYLVSRLGLNFPVELEKPDFRLTADILSMSADLYKKQFNNNEFYVLLYPVEPIYRGIVTQLKIQLLQRNIKVLDYSGFFGEHIGRFQLDSINDPHPNRLALQLISTQIANDMCR